MKMTEVDANLLPVGFLCVAKESLYKQKRNELKYLRRWHKTFVRTQVKAEKIARTFNTRLDGLELDSSFPRIKFLDCCVYEAVTEDGVECAYLVERRPNPKNYRKWNNNEGGVDGQPTAPAALTNLKDKILPPSPTIIKKGHLDIIEEEDEEDDEEDDDEDFEGDMDNIEDDEDFQAKVHKTEAILRLEGQILPDDIPQAFSHFSHVYTKRDQLVCDLQGELCVVDSKLMFLLTDPCIHSVRSRSFGRTDHGKKGIDEFFKTHKCSALCILLKIAGRDMPYWRF